MSSVKSAFLKMCGRPVPFSVAITRSTRAGPMPSSPSRITPRFTLSLISRCMGEISRQTKRSSQDAKLPWNRAFMVRLVNSGSNRPRSPKYNTQDFSGRRHMKGISKNCPVSSRFRYTRLLRIIPSRGISSAHSDSRYSIGDGNCPGRRLAITAALNPPAPVPQKTSGAGVPSATAHLPLYIAFRTPTSYDALAPPPQSTRPTRWFKLKKHPLVPLHWQTIQLSDRHIFSGTGWVQVKLDFPARGQTVDANEQHRFRERA